MGGTAMCPAGAAGEGDAGDQENGVKTSGELFVHIYMGVSSTSGFLCQIMQNNNNTKK